MKPTISNSYVLLKADTEIPPGLGLDANHVKKRRCSDEYH